jgi:hypothetical protein
LTGVGRDAAQPCGLVCGVPTLVPLAHRATYALGHSEAFLLVKPLIETIVEIVERDRTELGTEVLDLIGEMRTEGVAVAIEQSVRSKPFASFRKEPEIYHTVFVDEAGTAAWDEQIQPALTLVGVLVDDRRVADFESRSERLLQTFGLDASVDSTRSHASQARPRSAVSTPRHAMNC